MEIKILDINTNAASHDTVALNDNVFAKRFNEHLIHQVTNAYLAGARAGTKAQKTRAEVRGGGVKPFKQKGTGRARAGTIRSPLWRGGGKVFAAVPRDYTQKVNKKMYRGAICSILSELIREERLILVDNLVATGKTSDLAKKLNELKIKEALIVTDTLDPKLYLAARNLPRVDVCDVNSLNPINLVNFDKILFTVPAIKKVEEQFS